MNVGGRRPCLCTPGVHTNTSKGQERQPCAVAHEYLYPHFRGLGAHASSVTCSIDSSHPVHDERMKTWDSSVCATSYLVARMIREEKPSGAVKTLNLQRD